MEDELDNIEESGTVWQNVVKEFYAPFIAAVNKATVEGERESYCRENVTLSSKF
jgi:DNA topoisomerase IA